MNLTDKNICEDNVFIRDLELFIFLGLHDHEKLYRQKVFVDVEMMVRSLDAAKDLSPKRWIDYEKIHQAIVSIANATHFDLIEILAQQMVKKIFQITFADSVKISIVKPGVLSHTKTVGVSLLRHRSTFAEN